VQRFTIVLDHLAASVGFHGEHHGVRTFRKHLAAYIDGAPPDLAFGPFSAEGRKEARRRLCRLETMGEVAAALEALWLTPPARMAA
jgi:tRNA-dihydrouridine synthase